MSCVMYTSKPWLVTRSASVLACMRSPSRIAAIHWATSSARCERRVTERSRTFVVSSFFAAGKLPAIFSGQWTTHGFCIFAGHHSIAEAGFFAKMDLLTFANEGDHQGPRVHPLGKPEEIFRLARCMAAFLLHPLGIPGSLGLIIHPDMFVRDLGSRAAILFQESVNILDKDLYFQSMLENFHERAIAREEDRVVFWISGTYSR